jgi:hypothetical protein
MEEISIQDHHQSSSTQFGIIQRYNFGGELAQDSSSEETIEGACIGTAVRARVVAGGKRWFLQHTNKE